MTILLPGVCTHSSTRLADSCTPEALRWAKNTIALSSVRAFRARDWAEWGTRLTFSPVPDTKAAKSCDLSGSDPRFQVFLLHV